MSGVPSGVGGSEATLGATVGASVGVSGVIVGGDSANKRGKDREKLNSRCVAVTSNITLIELTSIW
jgi:hypothetical protein